MISYFKYTSGESFTLSGTDYNGLFNITDGRAYTGKSLTSRSEPLSTKGTFIGNSFLNWLNKQRHPLFNVGSREKDFLQILHFYLEQNDVNFYKE